MRSLSQQKCTMYMDPVTCNVDNNGHLEPEAVRWIEMG